MNNEEAAKIANRKFVLTKLKVEIKALIEVAENKHQLTPNARLGLCVAIQTGYCPHCGNAIDGKCYCLYED